MSRFIVGFLALVGTCATLLACKDDPAPAAESTAPSCIAIAEACHSHDTGSGPAHECHELAENSATTEATCVEQKPNCLSLCAEDAGAH